MRVMLTIVCFTFMMLPSFAQTPTDLSGDMRELVASNGSFSLEVPAELFVWQVMDNFVVSTIEDFYLSNELEDIPPDLFMIIVSDSPSVMQTAGLGDGMVFEDAVQASIKSISNPPDLIMGEPEFATVEDGISLAIVSITSDEIIAGTLYMWSYAQDQYLAVMMIGTDKILTSYASSIERIVNSVQFNLDSNRSNLGVKLLWKVQIESDEFMYGQVATDGQRIYVAATNVPIQVYSYDGEYIGQIDIVDDYSPADVAVDKDGNLWVADGHHKVLWHVIPDGEILNSIELSDDLSSFNLDFVGIDSSENIYTKFQFSEDVLIFQPDGTLVNNIYAGEEDDFVVRFEMWNDMIYANSIWNELRAYAIDGTSIDNRLIFIGSAFPDRQAFVPIEDNLIVMSTVASDDWSNVDIFLIDSQGNIILNFDLFDTIIGYRFLENVLPDPGLGYLDFASLGNNRFVILNPAYPDGFLYAFEIVVSDD